MRPAEPRTVPPAAAPAAPQPQLPRSQPARRRAGGRPPTSKHSLHTSKSCVRAARRIATGGGARVGAGRRPVPPYSRRDLVVCYAVHATAGGRASARRVRFSEFDHAHRSLPPGVDGVPPFPGRSGLFHSTNASFRAVDRRRRELQAYLRRLVAAAYGTPAAPAEPLSPSSPWSPTSPAAAVVMDRIHRTTVSALPLMLLCVGTGDASDNGLSLTPPMGWRHWKAFAAHIDQSIIERMQDEMVAKHNVDGNPTSLYDLGYTYVGLDDHWQNCTTVCPNGTVVPSWEMLHDFDYQCCRNATGHSRGAVCATRVLPGAAPLPPRAPDATPAQPRA
eukprot:gene20821-54382_t